MLLPAYRSLRGGLSDALETVRLAAQGPWPEAVLARLAGTGFDLWLLDCPALYDRPGNPYGDDAGIDHADNAARFGFLSHVAARLCAEGGPWKPWVADVLHANDWPTGLAPAYLSRMPRATAASVFTIHNLAFQGNVDAALAASLDVPPEWMSVEGILHWSRLSMMKAGLRHADVITTVSPTYAKEIQTPAFGCGLEGMLQLRAPSLLGILNGIDSTEWNPVTDALIPVNYGPGQWAAKARNKTALREKATLHPGPGMLFGMVSRLTEQKGVDLVLETLDRVIELGGQLVVLGSGDPILEHRFMDAAARHPGQVGVRIGFDEGMAHLIEAGADCFLMPSRFEPCGLNQMYSLVYGTPPVVNATGGLLDTVSDSDLVEDGTGFVMATPTTAALRDAIERAAAAFGTPARWRGLQERGMRQRFAWLESAKRYADVYADASRTRRPP